MQKIIDTIEYALNKSIDNLDRHDWIHISGVNFELNEAFIRRYHDKVYWEEISIYQELSEYFIEEFEHKVHWDIISKTQCISYEFALNHMGKLHLNQLVENPDLILWTKEQRNVLLEIWKMTKTFS